MKYAEAPLYVRSYDLARELIVRTRRFPKDQRFVLGARLSDGALDLVEAVALALVQPKSSRNQTCVRADEALTRVRIALRLCRDLDLVPAGWALRHGEEVDAIGRMLGGLLREPRSHRHA